MIMRANLCASEKSHADFQPMSDEKNALTLLRNRQFLSARSMTFTPPIVPSTVIHKQGFVTRKVTPKMYHARLVELTKYLKQSTAAKALKSLISGSVRWVIFPYHATNILSESRIRYRFGSAQLCRPFLPT